MTSILKAKVEFTGELCESSETFREHLLLMGKIAYYSLMKQSFPCLLVKYEPSILLVDIPTGKEPSPNVAE